jgi:hypothetical protein
MTNCPEYERLESYMGEVLAHLAQLTNQHLEAFRVKDFQASRRIDIEVERTIGEKERAIGALRQHMLEHKCQSGNTI